jgi:ankyrin repeat protein
MGLKDLFGGIKDALDSELRQERGIIKNAKRELEGGTSIDQIVVSDTTYGIGTPYKSLPLLHYALMADKSELVKFAMESGASVNATEATLGRNLLGILLSSTEGTGWVNDGGKTRDEAWRDQMLSMVSGLLSLNADVNNSDKEGNTPLILALKLDSDSESIVQRLLAAGAKTAPADNKGFTALHHAVVAGNLQMCRMLIDAVAPIPAADKKGFTALHHAVVAGNLPLCRMLIDAGTPISAADRKGCAALHYAASAGNIALCKMLIDAGARVNAEDGSKRTALHNAVLESNLEVCRMLISAGARINAEDDSGRTAMHYAASTGTHKMCEMLLTAGANVNAVTRDRETPLMCAVERGASDLCKLLLISGADIRAVDRHDNGVLFRAIRAKKPDVNAVLIEAGANINTTVSDSGNSLLSLAVLNDQIDLLKQLVSAKADLEMANHRNERPLYVAVAEGKAAAARILLAAGADINAPGEGGRTPLLTAMTNRDAGLTSLLLKAGANIRSADSDGVTPIMVAAHFADANLCKELIERGADVNQATANAGYRPLLGAIRAGSVDTVMVFIQAGADTSAVVEKGKTLLDYANEGPCEMVKRLMQCVADPQYEGVPEPGTSSIWSAKSFSTAW